MLLLLKRYIALINWTTNSKLKDAVSNFNGEAEWWPGEVGREA